MRIILLSLLSLTCAFSAPAWKGQVNVSNAGSHPIIQSSTLDYTLSWKGMLKAGALRIELAPKDAKKPGAFVVKSHASSRGAAAVLFPYQHNYWSESSLKTLRPIYFHATEKDDKETLVTTNRYSHNNVSIKEVSTKPKTRSKPAKTTTETFSFPHGPAYDVFSAYLTLRSQNLNPGDTYTMLLVPFKTPYLAVIKVEQKEKHMGRDAIRLQLAMKKIDRKSHALVNYKKLKRPVTLWLSDDADRVPLELRASVYIGDVRAVLTNHKKN